MSKAARPAPVRTASYHHGDLRAALRDEAERILVTRGEAEVSLREVARAVGVSHAAPYRHYAGREDLLADIAAGGFERLHRGFAALPPVRDPGQCFVAMAHRYVEFALAEPAVYRLMFGPAVRKADHPRLAEAGYATLARLREVIQALGVPAPATAETMAAWSLVHGLVSLILDQRLEYEPDKDEALEHAALTRRAAEIFLAGLRAPAGRRGAAKRMA